MSVSEHTQQVLLLFLWFLALGLDVGGLLRHAWRLRWRQRIYTNPRVCGDARLAEEAHLRRDNEIFRCEIKAGLAAWAAMLLFQRWTLWDEAPLTWAAWGIWAAHIYLVTVLYIWTERDR